MWLRGVVVTRRLTSGHLLCGEGNYPIFELYKSFHSQCSKLLLNIILNARFWMRKSTDVKTFLGFLSRARFFTFLTFFYFAVFLFLKTFVENTIWNHFRKNGNKLGLYDCFFCCSFFILGCCSNVSVCLSHAGIVSKQIKISFQKIFSAC